MLADRTPRSYRHHRLRRHPQLRTQAPKFRQHGARTHMSSTAGRNVPPGHRSPAAVTATDEPLRWFCAIHSATALVLRSDAPTQTRADSAKEYAIEERSGEGNARRVSPTARRILPGDKLTAPAVAALPPTANTAPCCAA